MLASYKHPNLVSLVGSSDQGHEKVLVYEYEVNGSLDNHLASTNLTWEQRLRICVGAARGLEYLHNGVGTGHRVLHCDIKSSNILLDANWEAKISDFGLSKIGPANHQFSFLVAEACGTFGYVDPLYIATGVLTKESDVYSFGVVLFEVLCGRLAMMREYEDERRFLSHLVKLHHEKGTVRDIIFSHLQEQVNPVSFQVFSDIAFQCLSEDRKQRPKIGLVVKSIETALSSLYPSLPYFYKGKKTIDDNESTEEDEQLAKALQESMNVDPPLPYFYGGYRVCAGCNAEIRHGRFLNCMGGLWHPECFRCHSCNLPISDHEFSMSENRQFHKSCYKEHHHPRCDVCKNFIPTNAAGLIEYRMHPFWLQKYCPSHEHDRTPRCCSCERMEARDMKYLLLDDGRKLCLECLDSAIMDTHECQPHYVELQEFYEGINMKIEQQVPLLLVERQALNKAGEGEKNGHHYLPETRGLCLYEEQTIGTIIRRPKVGAWRIMDMFTEPYKVVRQCEVTAILILYSLPRLLTGSILAHEMMHAWLRLKGFSNLPPSVEEGICQVLAHMWLDSEIMAGSGTSNIASTSSSSAPAAESSKKGKRSDFGKQLGEFFKYQIESDTSAVYGDGFRERNKFVLKYGLRSTLDYMRLTGRFRL